MVVDILLHCHQAGRSDLMQQQGKHIILITTPELQPGIIHVQINLGRDQQFYLLYLSWLIFSFLPAVENNGMCWVVP
ncbi:hypothetical protein NC651_040375 [Populus alba x Populus x berolinensis]|nr:hypothetical protein NC651_040375 [Populus alba x Populus x berolinensis]